MFSLLFSVRNVDEYFRVTVWRSLAFLSLDGSFCTQGTRILEVNESSSQRQLCEGKLMNICINFVEKLVPLTIDNILDSSPISKPFSSRFTGSSAKTNWPNTTRYCSIAYTIPNQWVYQTLFTSGSCLSSSELVLIQLRLLDSHVFLFCAVFHQTSSSKACQQSSTHGKKKSSDEFKRRQMSLWAFMFDATNTFFKNKSLAHNSRGSTLEKVENYFFQLN